MTEASKRRARTRGQMALWPITTRSVPAWRLCDGDSALRSAEVRRARGAMRDPAWMANNIDGWPHWPGGGSDERNER